jgi:hypothetical protein
LILLQKGVEGAAGPRSEIQDPSNGRMTTTTVVYSKTGSLVIVLQYIRVDSAADLTDGRRRNAEEKRTDATGLKITTKHHKSLQISQAKTTIDPNPPFCSL